MHIKTLLPTHWPLRSARALFILAICMVVLILLPSVARSQQSVPQKFTLSQIESLVTQKVPDNILSSQIHLHGLAFAPTQAIIDQLRGKGAGPLTLTAIGESIHEPNPSPKPVETRSSTGGGDLLYIPSDAGLLEVSPSDSKIRRVAKTALCCNDFVILNLARREFYVFPHNTDKISVISADRFTQTAVLNSGGFCENTYSTALSTDGRRLYQVCDNGVETRLVTFDTASGNCIMTMPIGGHSVAPNSRGDRLYIGGDGNIAEYAIVHNSIFVYGDDLKLLRTRNLAGLWPMVISPDGQSLFALQQNNIVRISASTLDIEKSLTLPETVHGANPAQRKLFFSRDGRYIFAAGITGIYRIPVSLDTYTLVRPPKSDPRTFQFAEAGNSTDLYVLGNSRDGGVWVIDLATGQLRKSIVGIAQSQTVICVPGVDTSISNAAPTRSSEPVVKPRNSRAARGTGTIDIQTEPGSIVLLDGHSAGSAGTGGFLTLPSVPAGDHELTASVDGFAPGSTRFTLAPNDEKRISLPLQWVGGSLSLSVKPEGATVSVHGPKSFEGTGSDVRCMPGNYTVTASMDGYISQTRTFQIAAGEHHAESFDLALDPAVLARKLDDAKNKLASGDPNGAERLADAVLAQAPSNPDASMILAQSAFQLGDMNRFVDSGTKAVRNGNSVTIRIMHVHTVLSLRAHPMDLTISGTGISLAANPPDSRCKVPPSVGFDLFQSAQVIRDPQHGFLDLRIQYASKPHGVILHDLDFVPEGSRTVALRQPGQIFGGGSSNMQEPENAGEALEGILRLIARARR